jgi:hypothetical protein
MRSFAIGGTGFGDAPFFADPQGQVIIGKNGSVVIQDLAQVNKGFIGVETESPKSVSGTANNGGLVRLTVTAHGYESGDTVLAGSTGYAITVIDANTIDLIDSVFGSFTPVATVTRYFAGVWSEQLAAGGTGFADALFRAKADGSVRIGDPAGTHFEVFPDGSILIGDSAGARLEVDAGTGEMAMIDASISITTADGSITIDADDGIRVESNDLVASLKDGYLLVEDLLTAGRTGQFNARLWNIAYATGGARIEATASSFESAIRFTTSAGTTGTEILDSGITTGALTLGTDLSIANGGTGASTAAGARTNLDVYSKAEVDALIPDVTDYYTKSEIDTMLASLSYASATHTHPVSDTTSGPSAGAAHTHPYSTSTGTPVG